MRTHARYGWYVLLHKLYVFRAGLALGPAPTLGPRPIGWLRWLWRLLIHDFSKLRPSEWRPYAAYFYGPGDRSVLLPAFNRAWLLHQHRNPHHWQHWLLREDSGKVIVLLMPIDVVDEMVCDWLAAGTKILGRPSLAECVALTCEWYRANAAIFMLRTPVRVRVELQLARMMTKFYGVETNPDQLRPGFSRMIVQAEEHRHPVTREAL